MPYVPESVIMEMVEAIVEVSAPEEVILFGSQSAHLTSSDSDVDLLVIMPALSGGGSDRRHETMRIERALSHFPYAKDVLLISRAEAEYWRDSLNNVIARALRTGRSIYGGSEASKPAAVAS